MQKQYRLTGTRQFSQIHQEGRSVANNEVVLRVLPNNLEYSRFGFVVSKRIGNSVVRNRVKRRLREIIRQASVLNGWDAVIIARRGSNRVSYQKLRSSVENLLQRSRLVMRNSLAESSR